MNPPEEVIQEVIRDLRRTADIYASRHVNLARRLRDHADKLQGAFKGHKE